MGGTDVFNMPMYPVIQARVDADYPTQTATTSLRSFAVALTHGAGSKRVETGLSVSPDETESLLHSWLQWLGLKFNPFQPLDAAADSHLSEYLVEHEVLARIWGDWNSFAFAPAGGGKSALRVRTAQACWVGQATNHPFPIPYLPPFLLWSHTHPSLDEHLAAISQAGAIRLLLALLYRPHWFLDLDAGAQRNVRQTLDWDLPGSLNLWLTQCRESRSISPLLEIFEPTFGLPDPPNELQLTHLCDRLSSIAVTDSPIPSASERWAHLVDLILETLRFRCIYFLIDGLDAVPETASDPESAVKCLSTLLPTMTAWTNQRVFVKGYFPEETQDVFARQFPDLFARAETASIHWTISLLADVIRHRIEVASQGQFGSLDAIASPAVRDIETMLAKIIVPLPREMLVLTQRVLWEHVTRTGTTGTIQLEDVDAAIAWYSANQPNARITREAVL